MKWVLPRDGGVETLAGFLLMRLGHIPHSGRALFSTAAGLQSRRWTAAESPRSASSHRPAETPRTLSGME